ncbi:uncharacterized protein LOC135848258 isoform X3 [Planococcus citri]|uniref:uncharacterized protein LOC135848258 isoform X3 n=1 Tax=Planococcus citri TaxID=170843 RepID=UPI0031F9F630
MDEMECDTNDATQPALITLQESSAITIARDMWRYEMNYYRTNDELEKFNPEKLRISLKTTVPDLPTVIQNTIEKYFSIFRHSMENWLKEHYKRVLFFNYGHQNYILEEFDDFVYDYDNCTVDYLKTAERMMRCDRLSDTKKFKVACTYFFEDDIRRIWPSVRKEVGLSNINFHDCPQLYYWICCLRNELNKIPTSQNETLFDKMLDNCMPRNGPSVEYFWNRIPYQQQVQKARQNFWYDKELVRLILPLFDDYQLGEFVNNHGCNLMSNLLLKRPYNETLVLETWMRMRNVMNEVDFFKLILNIFQRGPSTLYVTIENPDDKNSSLLCDEIWHSAPHDLRRSVIKRISSKFDLHSEGISISYRDHSADLLYTILTYATLEERYSFWHNGWRNFLFYTSFSDVQRIMDMCFENNDAMIQYKQNVMLTSDRLQSHCKQLIHGLDFKQLHVLVDFCCPSKDTAKLFKQQLLQLSFLGEKPVLSEDHFSEAAEFNEFINEAYDNADLATKFKSQLMSLPIIRYFKPDCISRPCYVQLNEFREFIKMFVSMEGQLKRIQNRVINRWKKNGIPEPCDYHCGKPREHERSIDEFLLWCLGSNEEVVKFKQTCVQPW